MTLIAAFRAVENKTGPGGIAICADSQETVSYCDEDGQPYELRRAVQKIEPIYRGRVHVAIAGAGNGELIEAFIERATRALNAGPEIASLQDTRALLETELDRFYNNDVASCPDEDRGMKLFVAATCPEVREYDFWVSQYAVLKMPRFPALVGWEHEMYSNTAARMNTEFLTLPQAILASIYTLTIAKETSNYVGGDLSVAVVRHNGIWMEKPECVAEMEARLKSYEASVNQVFLSCADTSVSIESLKRTIQRFEHDATVLHRGQIEKLFQGLTLEKIAQTNDPYPKFPLGASVIFDMKGNVIAVEDPERKESLNVYAKQAHDLFTKQGLVEYVVRRLDSERFLVLLSNRWIGQPDKELGEISREQLLKAYEGAKPFTGPQILSYLNVDGSEVVVYGDAMPPASQTSAGQP